MENSKENKGINKIISFLKKGQATKAKIIVLTIMSILIAFALTMVARRGFIWDRLLIFSVALVFVGLHLIFKIKDIYEFIYKYRYYIAGAVLILATLLEYSGSSIGIYNDIIQGESREKNFLPILGRYRSIRSDEWSVNTPIFVSQAVSKDNKFGYYNDNLRGSLTDMYCVVAPAVKDILILGKPFNIGFLLFGAAKGLSIIWYGKWIALALVSFEFFMLLTEKKKLLSLCGTLLIVFSAATQWWNETDLMMWGMLALLLLDKYLSTDKLKNKIICATGLFISAISYVFRMYPAWQIPFIWIYFALFIFLCIKNKKTYKIGKKDIPIILILVLAIVGMGIRFLKMSSDALLATMSTDYPGERFEIGGGGLKILFSYVYSFLFPYYDIDNPCELAGMLSFYPIPMILSVIYLIRNKDRKEHFKFFIPLLIVAIAFSVFTIFKTNRIFAKLTFLYMSTGPRLAVPLGFIQILLLIYLMSITNKESKIMNKVLSIITAIIASSLIFIVASKTAPIGLLTPIRSYACGIVLVVFMYLIFTMNRPKNKNILIMGLICMSIVTGATVNPIQKGISVLTDKPLAKQIQKIVNEDPENNLWITENTYFYMPNYPLASGAKVINSTNIYPNFELYKIVLGDEEYKKPENKKIFNRYAHITMTINKTQNKLELLFEDSIKVYLTPEKVKELKIKYIVATRKLEEFDTQNVHFEKLYDEQGCMIYKVNY